MAKVGTKTALNMDCFFIITQRGTTKLIVEDILYLEKELRRIHVQTTNGRYSFYGSFKTLPKEMEQTFHQCHASFLVNLSKICRLERNRIHLDGGDSIAVSQRKYPGTKERYYRYIQEKCSCKERAVIV